MSSRWERGDEGLLAPRRGTSGALLALALAGGALGLKRALLVLSPVPDVFLALLTPPPSRRCSTSSAASEFLVRSGRVELPQS
jgi:hypothetical protein